MAIKNFDSISSDIIDNVLIVNPLIDIKVGTVIRDVFIDVQASQIELLYGIANNTAQAMSVFTALNRQLDRIAANYGQKRNPPKRSATTLTVSIKKGLQAPTPFNVGDQFYTAGDNNNNVVTFINTQYQLAQPGQTQASLPVVSIETGKNQNVPQYSITKSNYDFADAVYNVNPAQGGDDAEKDAAFALRLPYVITGQYINVTRGILQSLLGISDINGSPYFVTPDNGVSRGPYTLDVYLQRTASYFGTATSEIVPANQQDYSFKNQPLYGLNAINQITTFNPVTNQTANIDPSKYVVMNDASDVQQFYVGSIKSKQILRWLVAPPATPYTVSYNYDHTIIDAQAAYDVHNELVSDTLFKQANAVPLYISINASLSGGTNKTAASKTANLNLINLLNSLNITQTLTDDEIKYTFLRDNSILDISLNNIDTTFEIFLTPGITSNFVTPSNQSLLTPLGYYWEIDSSTPVSYYSIAARLFIGKPDIINQSNVNVSTGFNLRASNKRGISYEGMIKNIRTSWGTKVYPFYDSGNELLILNFSTLPGPTDTISFNIVQDNIITDNLSYLTLAPSLVSPVNKYDTTIQVGANPTYATQIPFGLNSIYQATLYKNGVALSPTTPAGLGDYQVIDGPDLVTGLINLQFTNTPASTDIFQFGVLNPNINLTYSTSQFSR